MSFPHYGTVEDANVYFESRLNSDCWVEFDEPKQTVALVEATRLIDRLNFRGTKSTDLQFPRGTDTEVPQDVCFATYEIAIALLDGVDPDLEYQSAGIVSDTFANVKTSRETNYTQEHILAGIPSFRAWNYLKPYLRDSREINVTRRN